MVNVDLKFKWAICLSCFLFTTATCFPNDKDIQFILKSHPSLDVKAFNESPIEDLSLIKLLPKGAIKVYQNFISPQDKPTCNFNVSCSNFGYMAIKQRGVFTGILLTADRLVRCNDIALKYYEIDPVTGKAIDDILYYQIVLKGKQHEH